MRVAAHAHADQLDERGPLARTCTVRGPRERGRDRVRVRAIDRDARDAVPGRLVGEHAHGGLLADRRRQCRLVVLDAEHRRQFPRRAQVDRLVPLTERGPAFPDERERDAAVRLARERHREPGDGERADRERRRRRKDS